jgi:hypothetical protein
MAETPGSAEAALESVGLENQKKSFWNWLIKSKKEHSPISLNNPQDEETLLKELVEYPGLAKVITDIRNHADFGDKDMPLKGEDVAGNFFLIYPSLARFISSQKKLPSNKNVQFKEGNKGVIREMLELYGSELSRRTPKKAS